MSIETQPSPDGEYFQHSLVGIADSEPSHNFTDSATDLERLQAGDVYPMVTSWQEGAVWVIEVSLWSQNKSPSAEEIASLHGTLTDVKASTR